MIRARLLDWRVRLFVELAALFSTLALLRWNGAPAWASVLCFYIASRSSRLEDDARAGALQTTDRVRLEAIEKSIDRLSGVLDKAMHPNVNVKRRG